MPAIKDFLPKGVTEKITKKQILTEMLSKMPKEKRDKLEQKQKNIDRSKKQAKNLEGVLKDKGRGTREPQSLELPKDKKPYSKLVKDLVTSYIARLGKEPKKEISLEPAEEIGRNIPTSYEKLREKAEKEVARLARIEELEAKILEIQKEKAVVKKRLEGHESKIEFYEFLKNNKEKRDPGLAEAFRTGNAKKIEAEMEILYQKFLSGELQGQKENVPAKTESAPMDIENGGFKN